MLGDVQYFLPFNSIVWVVAQHVGTVAVACGRPHANPLQLIAAHPLAAGGFAGGFAGGAGGFEFAGGAGEFGFGLALFAGELCFLIDAIMKMVTIDMAAKYSEVDTAIIAYTLKKKDCNYFILNLCPGGA
jgi:hypothetical protein